MKLQVSSRNKLFIAGAVFVGGIIGTWLRAGTDLLLAHLNQHLAGYLTFTCGLFLVNLAGAFLLGYLGMKWELLAIKENRESLGKNWHVPFRTGVTTGMFGALTTYSSLSLLVAHNHIILDIIALTLLFIVGIAVASWGRKWARKHYLAFALPAVEIEDAIGMGTNISNPNLQVGEQK